MKSVLISIQPQWCEMIASGKKTIEVRKTRPKLETPFKVYIYCTRPKEWFRYSSSGRASNESLWFANGKVEMCDGFKYWCDGGDYINLNGKVIGEFICDAIIPMSVSYSNPNHHLAFREYPYTGLTDKQIMDYLGNGKDGYGWHITDLVIYDKPKDLMEFHTLKKCNACRVSGYESTACIYDEDCIVPAVVARPPQSWCYVEAQP
jgi:predicted transcriptional regulator